MSETEKPGETTQFIEKMDAELLGWAHPAERLREALDHDQFRLYAQPIVAVAGSGGIAMAEVLVRLHEGGNADAAHILPPGDFLPAFQHYKMMAELDRWVVRSALRKLGELGEGGAIRRLSVNVSWQTIEDPGFEAFVAMQLRLAALAPASLVFEIDETDALDRRAAAERFAAGMKRIGCQLLLDGFARRSVSFDALKALQVDYMKVDGTLIRNILRSAGAAAKLKAVLRAGEATGVGVIAECVEDDKVLAALRLLKVGYVQGFGVRRPEPIEDLFRI